MKFFLLAVAICLNFDSCLSNFSGWPNCSALSASTCDNYAGCSTLHCSGKLNTTALDTCSSYVSLEACQAAGCDWQGCLGSFSYPKSCTTVNDSIGCSLTNGCSWNNGACTGTLSFPKNCFDFTSQAACRIASGCLWMGNVCIGDFTGFQNCQRLSYYDCSTSFGCSTSCVFNSQTYCSAVQNSIDCYSLNGCSWNGAFCAGTLLTTAVTTPCTYFSNVTCDSWPGCSLELTSTCYNQACPDIFDFGTCIAKGCHWMFGNCVVPNGQGNLMISHFLLLLGMVTMMLAFGF